MLLLVPTEESKDLSKDTLTSGPQRILVILPPKANLGIDTMVMPRDYRTRTTGGTAMGYYSIDPTPSSSLSVSSPAAVGRRRHSTQGIAISSTSSVSYPFGSISFHSSKKDRRGSHIGFTRAHQQQLEPYSHYQHSPAARMFTSYSMSSAKMDGDDDNDDDNDSEDSYLVREAFKKNRTVRSPLLTSTSCGFVLGLHDRKDSAAINEVSTPLQGALSGGLSRSLPRGSTCSAQGQIPELLITSYQSSSASSPSSSLPSKGTTTTEATSEEEESNENENEDEDDDNDVDIEMSEQEAKAPRVETQASLRSATDMHPFLVSSSSLTVISTPLSPPPGSATRSHPLIYSAASSPTQRRRHVSEDSTVAYLTANDISSSLSATLTPLEIQNQLFHYQQRLARRRSSRRRARSSTIGHRQHHHHPPPPRQEAADLRRQESMPLPILPSMQQHHHPQDPLQQQLLSLALATPSRFGGVHPLDWDPSLMPPPPLPPVLRSSGPMSGALQSPFEEKWHPFQTSPTSLYSSSSSSSSLMDPEFSSSLLPKLPPSAFRTVESLKLEEKEEEERKAKERDLQAQELQSRSKTRKEKEQEEIDLFLVFPSPTL